MIKHQSKCTFKKIKAQLHHLTIALCRDTKPTKNPGMPTFGLKSPGLLWNEHRHLLTFSYFQSLAAENVFQKSHSIGHIDWNS